MVNNATSYSGSGLRDYLVQRVTSIVIASYVFCVIGFLITNSPVDYPAWYDFMSGTAMKIYSILALLCLVLHTWIGVWTIFTDYLKPLCIRLGLEIVVVLALVSFFIWGLMILWRI